jgi:hypothetical protein
MLDEEEINKKIKNAAEIYEPAFDDNAWYEMNQMLDKHLPQKKKRKRIAYLISLGILSAIGFYFVVGHKNLLYSPNSKRSSLKTLTRKIKSPDQFNLAANKATKNGDVVKNFISTESSRKNPAIKKINGSGKEPDISVKNKLQAVDGGFEANAFSVTSAVYKSSFILERGIRENDLPNEKNSYSFLSANELLKNPVNNNFELLRQKIVKDTFSKVAGNSKAKKAVRKQFMGKWEIGLTSGPDVSAVRLNNTGRLTIIKGIQLSYSLNDKFTLRSGFLVAKKIYSVDGDDYHSSYNSSNYYLQTVNANCKVYEAPLLITYNVNSIKKHRWFVSAGLSSYFMKRESYEYFYKYPSGLIDTKYYTVTNKNQYYFSVLDFSGGYRYNINKRLSLIAEPYIKLPMSGIGIGKIKLNSAGLFFTVNVKPF